MKFLKSVHGLLEIFTTLPFLLSYLILSEKSDVTQFFIMMDLCRLMLLVRFTKLFESEINREVTTISLSMFSVCLIMSAFTQHVENYYMYDENKNFPDDE